MFQGPEAPQDGPKMAQDATKTAPRLPKTGPSTAKTAQRWLKMASGRKDLRATSNLHRHLPIFSKCPERNRCFYIPEAPQDGPKMAQDGPKTAQSSPKMRPRTAKMAQRWLKTASGGEDLRATSNLHRHLPIFCRCPERNRHFKAPEAPQDGPKMAQDGPKTAPRSPKMGPRTAKMAQRWLKTASAEEDLRATWNLQRHLPIF